ncbi:MAG: hypothetical protein HYW34_01400 [Candidatus Brennerbacteria bacterium]|nr:hypothetical protein [Candidatus Brennerbacteria bacterium]
MAIQVKEKKAKVDNIQQLRKKAAIFDELIDFIENKGLGYLMSETEKETNLSFDKAKKLLT